MFFCPFEHTNDMYWCVVFTFRMQHEVQNYSSNSTRVGSFQPQVVKQCRKTPKTMKQQRNTESSITLISFDIIHLWILYISKRIIGVPQLFVKVLTDPNHMFFCPRSGCIGPPRVVPVLALLFNDHYITPFIPLRFMCCYTVAIIER